MVARKQAPAPDEQAGFVKVYDLERAADKAIESLAYISGYAWRDADRLHDEKGGWEGGRDLLNQTEAYGEFLEALKGERPEVYAAFKAVIDAKNEGDEWLVAFRHLQDVLGQA